MLDLTCDNMMTSSNEHAFGHGFKQPEERYNQKELALRG